MKTRIQDEETSNLNKILLENPVKANLLKVIGEFPIYHLILEVPEISREKYTPLFNKIGPENLIYIENSIRTFNRNWVLTNYMKFKPYEYFVEGKFKKFLSNAVYYSKTEFREIEPERFLFELKNIENPKKFKFYQEKELTNKLGKIAVEINERPAIIDIFNNYIHFVK